MWVIIKRGKDGMRHVNLKREVNEQLFFSKTIPAPDRKGVTDAVAEAYPAMRGLFQEDLARASLLGEATGRK